MKEKIKKISKNIKKINTKYENTISKRPLKYIFQFLPHNIFLLLLFIYIIITFTPQIIKNDVLVSQSIEATGVVGEIIDDTEEQEIKNIEKVGSFDTIKIFMATYARKNTSDYQFQLLEDNKVIYQKKFNASTVKDNSYYSFGVKKVSPKKGSSYKFKIIPLNAKTGNAITVYHNEKKQIINYSLNKTSPYYKECQIIFIIFIIITFIVNYLINNNKIKNEQKFLLLLSIYIIPICLLIPAYQVPDEPYHFYRAYNLSAYDITKLPGENLSNKSLKQPQNIGCLWYSSINGTDNIVSKKDINNCIKTTKNKTKKIPVSSGNNGTLAYVISAIGIKIADTFTNSPLIIFYVGRIANTLISLLLIYLAIKITPLYKKGILLMLSIPIFIQQTVSYSYDSILNALSLVLIAYIIKFINQKEQIEKKDLIIYTIISILLFNIKLPYGLLSLLILTIDKEKFNSKDKLNNKFKKILLMFILIAIGTYLTNYICTIGYISKDIAGENIMIKQLKYLFSNPLNIVLIAIRTIKKLGIWYLYSMVGIIGWLKIKMNYILIISFYTMLILLIFSEKSIINKRKRRSILMILLIIIGVIFGALYLGWSSYKLPYVEGVQGRYLLPLLVPLTLILMPKKEKIQLKNNTVYTYISMMLLAFIATILISYY